MIGSKIFKKKTCANSLDWARENIKTAPHGAVFLSDSQEVARGRDGRLWRQYPGQLLVTVLLKPGFISSFEETLRQAQGERKSNSKDFQKKYLEASDIAIAQRNPSIHFVLQNTQDERIRSNPVRPELVEGFPRTVNDLLTNLNMALTLGILHPLKKYGVGLKWPNDFILNNKKVGGMILESVWSGDELEAVILGFGLNVNTVFDSKDELSKIATSLVAHTKKQIDIDDLLNKLLASLNVYCGSLFSFRVISNDSEKLYRETYEEWKANQIYLNKEITVHKKDGTVVNGIAKDFLSNGDLVLSIGQKEEVIPFYTVTSVMSVPN